MNICVSVHTVRGTVVSISSCVVFMLLFQDYSMNICVSVSFYCSCSSSQHQYVSVPGLSMNICVSVSFYCSCSSSQHQFLLCFYPVPGLSMNICVSVSFYCSFKFSSSVLVFVFMLVFQD